MQLAHKQGYETVFATTVVAAGILKGLGWKFLKTFVHEGEELSLYCCKLQAQPNNASRGQVGTRRVFKKFVWLEVGGGKATLSRSGTMPGATRRVSRKEHTGRQPLGVVPNMSILKKGLSQ